MKKLISLLLALCLLLAVFCFTSCESATEDEAARIGVLAGPTGMGLAELINRGNESYEFTVYSDPSVASTDLAAGNLDLLCLPTNTAANLYKKTNGQIRVLAVNCLGSLYLISNSENPISSLSDLEGKTVWASVPTSTTKPILDALFAKAGVNVNVEMASDHDSLVAQIATGNAEIAVLPEPKATAAILQNSDYAVRLNLNDAWEQYSSEPLAMGCIVVRSAYYEEHKEKMKAFLADYETSVKTVSDPANIETSAQAIVDAGVLPKLPVAKKALGNLYGSIVLLTGEEMKSALIAFYGEIGQELPEDDFYLIAN